MTSSPAFEETRRILLRRYEVNVRMGIHDFEREGAQRIWVSVELWLGPREAPKADRIDEVLDYDFLREAIGALAASRHFNLQETFVEAVMDICLSRPEVVGALVRTEKPDVYPDTEAVGFELTRFKTDAD
jgi:dihydroneopterin aldolase